MENVEIKGKLETILSGHNVTSNVIHIKTHNEDS